MRLNQLDVITPDVPAATALLSSVLGISPSVAETRFAEFDVGGFTVMLSPDALVPVSPARGVILHVEVDDVDAAVERARNVGAAILRQPAETDWGTYSALIAGPEEVVIDFFRRVG